MNEATTDTGGASALRIQRLFDVPPAQLFGYFTEAEHLAAWFGPKGVLCHDASVDARTGGNYQLRMTNPDASEIVLVGCFLRLEAPRFIEMTWRWYQEGEREPGEETLVTIEFSSIGDGTLLKLTHQRFEAEGERNRHEIGWGSTLDCLAEYVSTVLNGTRATP